MNKKDEPVLTKRQLATAITRETKINIATAHNVVDLVFRKISETLVAGGHCEFRDFGVFETSERRPRTGRNPRKPEDLYQVPARRVAKFRAGRDLRLKLKESVKANSGDGAAQA